MKAITHIKKRIMAISTAGNESESTICMLYFKIFNTETKPLVALLPVTSLTIDISPECSVMPNCSKKTGKTININATPESDEIEKSTALFISFLTIKITNTDKHIKNAGKTKKYCVNIPKRIVNDIIGYIILFFFENKRITS